MIVPIRAASVARANPSARVRRKNGMGTAASAEASADEDDAQGPIAPAGRGGISAAGRSGPRTATSRPTAAFLASLLMLRRGG